MRESRRRDTRGGGALLAAMLANLAVLAAAAAAERPQPPPFYAIRGATVVTGTGETLEQATVLIADGLIEAVGRDLEIPADAWVIEGQGLTVYPGLIDGLTNLAQAQAEGAGGGGVGVGGGGGGGGGAARFLNAPRIRGPEDRPQTTPWVSAADLLSTEDSRIESWREAGFTSAVTAPEDGFFAGQATLVNLGGEEARDMVVATPVAQRVSYGEAGGFRNFPGSLMGQIAYVKQVLSDARHYAEAAALYEASPQGRERPRYDRSLAPVVEALAGGLPILLPGDLGREITRALDLAAGYQLPAVVVGARGAYERLQALAASGRPVLVSLDWPEEEHDRDPDADTPLRTLYHRRMAPVTPKLLAEAGVPFAFYSDGLGSPSKIFAGLRRAIASGLPEEAALAALTLGAARIYGVDDRLGSIEPGKIANLVVSTAAPWAEDAEVAMVFVDGVKYEKRESDEPREPPASDVSGAWTVKATTSRGERESRAELEMTPDGKVTGEISGERGTRTIEKGRMSGDVLTFKLVFSRGTQTFEISHTLTVTGDTMTGTALAGSTTMDLAGERVAAARPRATAADEAPAVSLEELERAIAVVHGPVREYDAFAVTHARVYTVAGETIDDGTVVVRDGKIAAVGAGVAVPPGVEVIDAGGGSLIPGIIDAHSHIATEAVNEGALAVTSMVTIQDVLNPDDVSIYRALAGGVTTINVLHGSANPIGGGNAVIKLRWGQDADGLRFAGAPPGIKFALGENPKRSRAVVPGMNERYPATRMGVMDVIRQSFVEARTYQKQWQDYERARAAGRRPIPPRRDLKLEPLVEILAGERLVHAHCYRADEILQLLRLAEEFGFRIATLQHVLEGYKVADEIAAHGAGASTFSDWWGYKVEAYDAIPHNAALMTERGVVVSINSDSGEEMRHLNQEAAKTMKWGGLDENEALKLVTLNPARQLRIDGRVGSIEVGKEADLVLYDGHPLSAFSVVLKTFVDGDLYFDRAADRDRQTLIDELKRKLGGASEDDEEETPADQPETAPEVG